MQFSHEYPKRLKACFIGGGAHAYSNVLPCFPYLPIEITALSDENRERGLAMARQYGVRRFYPSHSALLAKEDDLDVAFIVAGPDENGLPRYPELAADTLRANLHTWVDAPPCRNADDISIFTNACIRSDNKYVMAGLRRLFAPVYEKTRQIITSSAFGGVSSFAMQYPLILPEASQRTKPGPAQAAFLEFVQPISLLLDLFGDVTRSMVVRSQAGDAMLTMEFSRGVVGTLYLTGNQAATGSLERLQVLGHGAHVVVDNGSRLCYYPAGGRRGEGRSPEESTSFIGPDAHAPIIWEPEFTLGRPYNKAIFLQGYYDCLLYFAQQLLAGDSPKRAHLVQILQAMTLHDRIIKGKDGEWLGA